MQLSEDELRRPINGHEEVELALLSANLGNVEVEVADRITLEGFLATLSPAISGRRLIAWRLRHRCRDDRVRCGIVACKA